MKISKGDYVNSYRVEDVRVVANKQYILITYMDERLHKPQSIWITQNDVNSHMSKAVFDQYQININKTEDTYDING